MKKVSVLTAIIMMISSINTLAYAEENSIKIYVSPNGNDIFDGMQLTTAVKSIERAQELARWYKEPNQKTEVIFKEGVYFIDSTFTFTAEDSGTDEYPVIYRAYQGDDVKFTLAKEITPSNFTVSQNTEISESARGNVLEADLSEFTNLTGNMTETLYAEGEMQSIAAWPNTDFVSLTPTGESTGTNFVTYYISEEKRGVWTGKTNMRYEYKPTGYTYNILPVSNITNDTMTLQNAASSCRILNALSEVDVPGEYYIDAQNKKLYYYPKSEITNSVYLAEGTEDTIVINGAENLRFESIELFCGNARGFEINNADNIVIYDAVIKAFGEEAIYAQNTTNLLICASNISDLKRGGINISGGEQLTLTSSGNEIRNCRVFNYDRVYKTAAAGIALGGVGAAIRNCEIFESPNIGILFTGNNHIIENNKVYDVIKDVWDAGAIYCGRSWLDRGTIIRNNYIYSTTLDYGNIIPGLVYNSGTDNHAIYIDDLHSGITVTGNIIYNMSRGLLFGGGSDNICQDNIIINCRRGISYDNQGMGWRQQHIDGEQLYAGQIYKKLKEFMQQDYDEELWNNYDGFEEMIARVNVFDAENARIKADDTLTAAQKTAARKAALNVLGAVYNRKVNNNVYTGAWAEWWNGTYTPQCAIDNPGLNSPTHISMASAIDSDDTNSYIILSNTAAGIEIDNYEITISGANLPEGMSSSTENMGVVTDEYIPSYSVNEFDVNNGNRFVAVAAIYDSSDRLVSVHTKDNVYMYDNQLIDMDIDIPQEVQNGWYIKLMFFDNINNMYPVSTQEIIIGK